MDAAVHLDPWIELRTVHHLTPEVHGSWQFAHWAHCKLCAPKTSLSSHYGNQRKSVPTEIEVSHSVPSAQPAWPLQDKLPSPVSIGNRPLQLLGWLADFRRAAWRKPDHKEGASWSVIIINTCRALSPSLVPLTDCYLVNCCYHCHHQLNNRV